MFRELLRLRSYKGVREVTNHCQVGLTMLGAPHGRYANPPVTNEQTPPFPPLPTPYSPLPMFFRSRIAGSGKLNFTVKSVKSGNLP